MSFYWNNTDVVPSGGGTCMGGGWRAKLAMDIATCPIICNELIIETNLKQP